MTHQAFIIMNTCMGLNKEEDYPPPPPQLRQLPSCLALLSSLCVSLFQSLSFSFYRAHLILFSSSGSREEMREGGEVINLHSVVREEEVCICVCVHAEGWEAPILSCFYVLSLHVLCFMF